MNKTLMELTSTILNFRDARDWKQFHTLKNMAISLSLESSEVLEIFQWKTESESREELDSAQKESLSDELSDVLYWILLLAHDAGIDLQAAFKNKMTKNEIKYPVETSKGSSKKYNS